MRAKKSLGQNFLRNAHIARVACDGAELQEKDTVLEIGPGKGVLTKILLEKARVVAVEKDYRLIEYLKNTFKDDIAAKRFILIEGDILDYNIYKKFLPKNYKVVANIPYYITGKLLPHLFSLPYPPTTIVLMVQKEVGERIVATDGKESILSVSVKAKSSPKIIKRVPAKNFSPVPKIDSVLILFKNIRTRFTKTEEKKFFAIVKKGFAHKRKLLKRNLGIPEEALHDCNIRRDARAENLSVEDWVCLAQKI